LQFGLARAPKRAKYHTILLERGVRERLGPLSRHANVLESRMCATVACSVMKAMGAKRSSYMRISLKSNSRFGRKRSVVSGDFERLSERSDDLLAVRVTSEVEGRHDPTGSVL
jgi:hypothetical protein